MHKPSEMRQSERTENDCPVRHSPGTESSDISIQSLIQQILSRQTNGA